jgi:putative PIN family toxin of toxin-antitoxin system
MRVVLDTNILVSALIAPAGYPAAIYNAWEQGRFTLLTCAEHLAEVRATLRKPRIAALIDPYKAGRLINQIKKLAANILNLPHVRRSADPDDNFLLAVAEAGAADCLVTGDKSGLLTLEKHSGTQIITARQFADRLAGRNRISETSAIRGTVGADTRGCRNPSLLRRVRLLTFLSPLPDPFI